MNKLLVVVVVVVLVDQLDLALLSYSGSSILSGHPATYLEPSAVRHLSYPWLA